MFAPDYVLVGHVTRDLIGGQQRPGGTVLYAGVTALRLGRRVAIVTSHGRDSALPVELAGATIATIPADATTTFALDQRPDGRTLSLITRAQSISLQDVPEPWRSADIIHLAPIAWEVAHSMTTALRAKSLVATPQGWLRRANPDGTIVPDTTRLSGLPLEGLAALVTSAEDLGFAAAAVEEIVARTPVAAITHGADGCTLYTNGMPTHIPPWPANERDSTGAGDVFATALFIRFSETGDPIASARFAACVAALSVEGPGVSCIPTREQVEERLWRA